MKILLIAGGRCGSYSVLDWISGCLGLKIIYELDEINVSDNFIVKRDIEFVNSIDGYDYVIRLYRENTIKSAESALWAISNKSWHNPYRIPYEFLVENHNKIMEIERDYSNKNDILKQFNHGLLISYEEIFIDKTGQEKLENFLGFKSQTRIDTNDKKVRDDNPDRTTFITYELIIKKLKEDYKILQRKYREKKVI